MSGDSLDLPFVQCWFAGRLPKPDAPSIAECEDFWAVENHDGVLHVAVTDGASDSLFAAEWAARLAHGFCETGELRHLGRWQAVWNRERAALPLPWYAEAKRDKGAFAAVCGLRVFPPSAGESGGTWEAVAVGDSVVFQVRGAVLVAAFPISRADDFSGLPVLLGTNAALPAPPVATYTGAWEPGDDLFLVTDALGMWCLHEHEQNRPPWAWLRGVKNDADFARRIQELQATRKLRGDDITLVHLHFPDGSKNG